MSPCQVLDPPSKTSTWRLCTSPSAVWPASVLETCLQTPTLKRSSPSVSCLLDVSSRLTQVYIITKKEKTLFQILLSHRGPVFEKSHINKIFVHLNIVNSALLARNNLNEIRLICLSPFTRKLSLGALQSQNPQVSTVARKNSLLTGRNLEQDPTCWESAG